MTTDLEALAMRGSAVLSPCGLYRYRLERGQGRAIAFIMVNPSTADATADDATIRKVQGFASRAGYSRIIVGNKFAWRATDIRALRSAASHAIGPENDSHIEGILRDAEMHVAAWGALTKLPKVLQKRWIDVVRIADRVGCRLHCIGAANDGHPLHPLMPGYHNPIVPWEAPWFPSRALSQSKGLING